MGAAVEQGGRRARGAGRRVVIIGGGVAGTSLVVQLMASRAVANTVASVHVVDPRAVGWGLAFGDDDPLLMCNSAVSVNSVRADRPDDFIEYVKARGRAGQPGDVVPRADMARYCASSFLAARERAGAWGVPVEHVPAAATAVRGERDGYRVLLSDGRKVTASDVIVCVGVHRPRIPDGFAPYVTHPRYVAAPYPSASLRERVAAGSRVLVVGSRQSAIDAALVLCREGHRVTMTSRSGRLPAVRKSLAVPPVVPGALAPLERLARLDPDDPHLADRLTRCVVRAIRQLDARPLRHQTSQAGDPVQRLGEETELAESGACTWADISVALIEAVIDLFPALSPGHRAELLRHFSWFTDRYVTAMTTVNARRLLTHFATGALRFAPAYPGQVRVDDDTWQVHQSSSGFQVFDYVVNATGFDLPRLSWAPEGSLLHLGHAPPGARPVEHLGEDLRLPVPPLHLPQRIWLAGVPTHVRIPFSHHLRNVVRQTRCVAQQLTRPPATP